MNILIKNINENDVIMEILDDKGLEWSVEEESVDEELFAENVSINDYNVVKIILGEEETIINNKIFEEELTNYQVRLREEVIDSLIDWISEAEGNDQFLMKEDLNYLMSLKDKYLLNNISTNEYIVKSDNKERYLEIIKEILKLNKEVSE